MVDGRGQWTRACFERHPLLVSFELLGCVLTNRRDGETVTGRIVEVEAYAGPEDPASHAAIYRAGPAALAARPGTLYMYRSYGIHTMLNIVTHEQGAAGAVLIRAVEPLAGKNVMRSRRGPRAARLASGPGSLCQAFSLRLPDQGTDLLANDWLRLERGDAPARVHAGPRIGISRGVGAPWRLFDADSADVSAHRRGEPVTRETLGSLIPAFDPGSSGSTLAPRQA
jgi:DNA-3-methyladenine glycosylase